MKRVLALVAAVAMVGGALLVRSQVIDKKSSSGTTRGSSTTSSVPTIGCAPELTAVCQAAAGKNLKVLANPVDLADAAAAAPKLDAWLTYGPAPGMVNAGAPGQAKVFESGEVVGSGRLAAVTARDRSAALARHCSVARLTWACLTRSANLDWAKLATNLEGTVKIGAGDPASALGTILLGPLALATAGRPDPGIDDIDTTALAAVVTSVNQQPSADELTDLVTKGFGAYSVVVAPEAAARQAADSTRGQSSGLTVIYPDPVARTVVVLTPPSGRQVPRAVFDAFARPDVGAALTQAGWAPTRQGTTSGLPAPDVLFALRTKLAP